MQNTVKQTASLMISAAIEKMKMNGTTEQGKKKDDTVSMSMTNPRSRHALVNELAVNPFESIAGAIWKLAGANNPNNPYLTFFKEQAGEVDGNVINDDTPERFQEIITKFDPTAIRTASLNLSNMVFTEKDGCLNAFVVMDIINLNTFDVFPYALLHEMLYNEYKKKYPEVSLGSFTTIGLTGETADTWEAATTRNEYENHIKTIGPAAGPTAWPHFFGSLLAQFGSMITQELSVLKDQKLKHANEIENLFDDYGVAYGDLMYEYVNLLYTYILSKKGVRHDHRVTGRLTGDLLHVVTYTKHRTFNLME